MEKSSLKKALKDWIKVIKQNQQQFKNEDYYYTPEQKQYDEGYIKGMIAAKIWFEKYDKRLRHEENNAIVYGRWVDKGMGGDICWATDGKGACWRIYECSVCKCHTDKIGKYCQSCGTKME